MTKDEIINCTDGQALADAVAVEVMGYEPVTHAKYDRDRHGYDIDKGWADSTGLVDYEPHKPTEKGKAQCWDLITNMKFTVDINDTSTFVLHRDTLAEAVDDNPQIAVLKAALLTVKE